MTVAEAALSTAARNRVGIAATLAASFLYILSDAAMKLASAIPAGERVFLRSLGVVAVLALLVAWSGLLGQVRRALVPQMGARVFGDAGNSLFFQAALSRMPLADAMGILQLTPLALTGAAAIFLGAPVGWRRWSAIAVGLVGALLVIKPGLAAFNPWGLLVILSLLASVWRDLATRRFDTGISPLVLLLVSQAGVGALSLAGVVVEDWAWPSLAQWGQIAIGATFFAGGHLAAIYAIRESDWSVVAPFRYAGILWAIAFGFLIWGDLPDALSLMGIALLIAAGGYTFHRERRQLRGH